MKMPMPIFSNIGEKVTVKMKSVGHLHFPSRVHFGKSLKQRIEETSSILKLAYADYGPEIGLCFNGGKDSTVVLDIVKRFHDSAKIPTPVTPYFFKTSHEFPEISSFVNQAKEFWNVEIKTYEAESVKSGLEKAIDETGVKACFIGQRSTDINSSQLSAFTKTTEGWPNLIRVYPILPWTYKDIWEYLDKLKLPTCPLYSLGYTSIGSTLNTIPNPKLLSKWSGKYMHARKLRNPADERAGRIETETGSK